VISQSAGHQRSKLARPSRLQRLNTSRCLVVVPKSYGCGLNYQIMASLTIASLYTVATTTTTLPLPPQPQQGPSDPIIIKRMGELEEFIANLVEENQALETRLDKQGSRINKLETMDLPKMIREQKVCRSLV
ncbi:hypothetical protein Tco_1224135, partial [Tanacetum coccineum]